VEIQPDHAEAWKNLGNALLQEGRVEEAIADYKKAVEIKPAFAEAYNNLGIVFLQKGQTNEAVIHFQKAVQINPGFPEAQRVLGNLLLETGRGAEAIAHYQTALELQPQNSGVQNNLAWILATYPEAAFRNGLRAVALAEQANRFVGGNNPMILRTLAAAYAEAGRFPQAVATAQQAIELATAQDNTALVISLRTQLAFYQANTPFKDVSLTNGPAAQAPP
jgi:Flp pilus assembly protein TadD